MAAALGTPPFLFVMYTMDTEPLSSRRLLLSVKHGAATSTPGATALYWPESLPRGLGGVGWTVLEISWWRTENFAKTLLLLLFKAKSSFVIELSV